jgi:hypothetical protein
VTEFTGGVTSGFSANGAPVGITTGQAYTITSLEGRNVI